MTTKITQYGFEFGSAIVERLAQHRGYVFIGVRTKRQQLAIAVTPSGLIRVEPVHKLAPKTKTQKIKKRYNEQAR